MNPLNGFYIVLNIIFSHKQSQFDFNMRHIIFLYIKNIIQSLFQHIERIFHTCHSIIHRITAAINWNGYTVNTTIHEINSKFFITEFLSVCCDICIVPVYSKISYNISNLWMQKWFPSCNKYSLMFIILICINNFIN